MYADIHKEHMSYAIEIAEKGRGNVSPNPLVGCIIVKEGKIIGEGHHEHFGENHAEVNAFNNCIEDPIDADLYVTLEPCSYFGKTPPCVNAIISNSIKNVFIGIKDPNEKINGSGIELLEKAGINVVCGILENECKEQNIGFFNWIETGKPWVVAKVAQTKNGYMGIDSNKSVWLTGEDSKKEVHKLRSKVDGILIGRKTAQTDNPQLTVREVEGKNPTRIIADTYRKLNLNLKLFKDNESKNIVLCSKDVFEDSATTFCNYLPIKTSGEYLNPHDILKVLGEHGFTSIMIEGGKKILESFLNEDLINEIHLYTSNNTIDNSKLKNPLKIDETWKIVNEKIFDNDNLIIARKKELCLQES